VPLNSRSGPYPFRKHDTYFDQITCLSALPQIKHPFVKNQLHGSDKIDANQQLSDSLIQVFDYKYVVFDRPVVLLRRGRKPIPQGHNAGLDKNDVPLCIDREDLIDRGLLNGMDVFKSKPISLVYPFREKDPFLSPINKPDDIGLLEEKEQNPRECA
jgi:hypothetical protein